VGSAGDIRRIKASWKGELFGRPAIASEVSALIYRMPKSPRANQPIAGGYAGTGGGISRGQRALQEGALMMVDYSGHFGLGDGIWMNTAHQGALPLRAAAAAKQAIDWKLRPEKLTSERFVSTPARLRRALAVLIGAPEKEITLANSASYGLHLIANALSWRDGDEVIVMATDFPSDILPWLTLEPGSVSV
jgi:hypothetical protein